MITFGRALEWHSGGRWFKSSHSDQETLGNTKFPRVFLLFFITIIWIHMEFVWSTMILSLFIHE